MRTSRVGGTTSALYRNSKLFVRADEVFADVMDNDLLRKQQNPREQFNQNEKKNKKAAPKAIKLTNIKSRLIIKGMQFDANSASTLNRLGHYSAKVSRIGNLKIRNTTYRTSI